MDEELILVAAISVDATTDATRPVPIPPPAG
jgi:hypothetical protein